MVLIPLWLIWYELWSCRFSSDVFSTDTFSKCFTGGRSVPDHYPNPELKFSIFLALPLVCSLSHMVANHLKDKKHWALLVSWGHILNSFLFFLSCNIQDFGNIGIAGKQKMWGLLQPIKALYFVKSWCNKETLCLWKTLWQLKKYGE